MCPENGTIQCALGMNCPMYPGNETSQCSLGMRLAYVLFELDYPMCPGMGLDNVPWEWD